MWLKRLSSVPALLILVSLIIGSFIITAQVIKQKSIEKQIQMKIDQDTQERVSLDIKESLRQDMINTCFFSESSNYSANWDGECKLRSLKDNCSLPAFVASRLGDQWKDAKDNCLKRYNK